jgi:hypothetical protein
MRWWVTLALAGCAPDVFLPEQAVVVDADEDGISDGQDCDPTDPAVGLAPLVFTDADDDGFGDDLTVSYACVPAADAVRVGGDCDDQDNTVFPGAVETCDATDQDCDGDGFDVAAADLDTWYYDGDADDEGRPDVVIRGCTPPDGFVAAGQDCDDLDPGTHPGASEVCDDGADNDCDGVPCVWGAEMTLANLPSIAGASAGGLLGSSFAIADDLDGDGVDDLIAGAPGTFVDGELGAGALVVFAVDPSDRAVSSRYVVEGAGANSRLGQTVVAAGDLDDDGFGDVLAGRPSAGTDGLVYLLGGPVRASEDVHAGALGGYFTGAVTVVRAAAADLDGDGVRDVAIGNPEYGGRHDDANRGRVAVFRGGNNRVAYSDVAELLLEGPPDGHVGERPVHSVGDVDGDGRDDLLVTTRDLGRMYLVYGLQAFPSEPWVTLDDPPNDVRIDVIEGPVFAGTAAVGADLDGNGINDLVVTDGESVGIGGVAENTVWVVRDADLASGDLDDLASVVIRSGQELAFGTAVSAGIVNGGPAVVVAANPRGNTGEVHVLYPDASWFGASQVVLDGLPTDVRVSGGATGDYIGAALDLGDLDGDGLDDLVFSSPTRSGGRGQLFFVWGTGF